MHTWLSRSGQWTPSAAFMRELAQKAYRAVDQKQLDAAALRGLPVKADELMQKMQKQGLEMLERLKQQRN